MSSTNIFELHWIPMQPLGLLRVLQSGSLSQSSLYVTLWQSTVVVSCSIKHFSISFFSPHYADLIDPWQEHHRSGAMPFFVNHIKGFKRLLLLYPLLPWPLFLSSGAVCKVFPLWNHCFLTSWLIWKHLRGNELETMQKKYAFFSWNVHLLILAPISRNNYCCGFELTVIFVFPPLLLHLLLKFFVEHVAFSQLIHSMIRICQWGLRDADHVLWFTMQAIAIRGSNNATSAHEESFQIGSSDLLISFIHLLKHFLHQYRIVDALAYSPAHYLKSVMFIKRLGLFLQNTWK